MSWILWASIRNRNADIPQGLTVEKAASPTTTGRATDLIPSAAAFI